jgi:hypothetical protein
MTKTNNNNSLTSLQGRWIKGTKSRANEFEPKFCFHSRPYLDKRSKEAGMENLRILSRKYLNKVMSMCIMDNKTNKVLEVIKIDKNNNSNEN